MTKQVKQLQVAVSGYDAVAYFDGQAIAGDPAFSSVHNDSLYQFTSEANKEKLTRHLKASFHSTAAIARPQPAKENFLVSIRRTSRLPMTIDWLFSIAVLVGTPFTVERERIKTSLGCRQTLARRQLRKTCLTKLEAKRPSTIV